jgi:hypothetical protein
MDRRRTPRENLSAARLAVGALALLLLLPAGPASALSERITFDFTGGSVFSLLGGTIVTPPDGTLDVGTVDLFVEVTAPGVYVPGGAFVLDGISLAGTVAKNLGAANIAGSYAASQVAPLVGTLDPGLGGGHFVDDLALTFDTQIGCSGSGCASLGFPVSDVGVSLFALSFLPVTDLTVPGAAQITASFAFEVDGVLGHFDLVGVEVARAFIPEPGTFLLVATGCTWIAAMRRRVRAIA